MVSMLRHGITNFSGIVAKRYTSGADAMAVTTVTFPASVGTRMPRARLLGTYAGGTFKSSLEITIRLFPGRPLRRC
jgi:hypothetical protein